VRRGGAVAAHGHVILDNGSSHVSKQTKARFAAHPRWIVHDTPPHASWVNQVELFSSILQRKVIRNGNFTSRHRQAPRLHHRLHQTARPFRWTYATDPLVAARRGTNTRPTSARQH
jgi:transposase